MVKPEDIATWIEAGLPNSRATVTGDGRHFEAFVVCPDFADQRELARHRMIYAALGDKMDEAIHALSLKTSDREE